METLHQGDNTPRARSEALPFNEPRSRRAWGGAGTAPSRSFVQQRLSEQLLSQRGGAREMEPQAPLVGGGWFNLEGVWP